MTPKIYTHQIIVAESDIDELNHVNNVKYFGYLQEAAIAHWYTTVPLEISEPMRWVVKKHEIEYFSPAFLEDILVVKTWIKTVSGVTSHRYYEIFRNETLIVKANTLWVALDALTMKPKRVPPDLYQKYFLES